MAHTFKITKVVALLYVVQLLFSSCFLLKKKNKQVIEQVMKVDTVLRVDRIPPPEKDTVASYEKYYPKSIVFNSFQCKAKCTFDDGKKNLNFSATIKVRNDSAIQISAVGLGILEVARLLITPDSIFVVDKINNVAYIKEFSYLKNVTGVDLKYSMLQDIIINNLPKHKADIEKLVGNMLLINTALSTGIQIELGVLIQNKLWQNMVLNYQYGDLLKFILQYEKYQIIQDRPVSMKRNISIIKRSVTQSFEMELDKIHWNEPVNFSISIPNKFKIVR